MASRGSVYLWSNSEGWLSKQMLSLAESWPGAHAVVFLLFFDVVFGSIAFFLGLVSPTLFYAGWGGALFTLVLFFKSSNDNGSEAIPFAYRFKSLFPVLCRTPCGSEWLHSQPLNANATVVGFLISASLTMTLSQAWFYMKEETKTGRKATLIK